MHLNDFPEMFNITEQGNEEDWTMNRTGLCTDRACFLNYCHFEWILDQHKKKKGKKKKWSII